MIREDIRQTILNYGKNSEDIDQYNKWIKRYISFIEACQTKDFSQHDDVHIHHICPKSWDNRFLKDKENLIKLPFRYHIVAHQLLSRTTEPKMQFAFMKLVYSALKNTKYKHRIEYLPSRIIEEARNNCCTAVVQLSTGKVFKSVQEAIMDIGCSGVSLACNTCCKIKGSYWAYLTEVQQAGSVEKVLQSRIERNRQLRDKALDSSRKAVINLNTLQVYRSARDADRAVGAPLGTIGVRCRTGHKYEDCYWARLENVDKNGVEYELQKRQNKSVTPVINLTTEKQYPSMTAAINDVKKTHPNVGNGAVQVAIYNKTRLFGQYWATIEDYEKFGKQELLRQYHEAHPGINVGNSKASKQVIDLVTGKVYPSTQACSRAFSKERGFCRKEIGKPRPNHYFVLLTDYQANKQHYDQLEQQRKAKYELKRQKQQTKINTPTKRQGRKIINVVDGTIYESGVECSRAFGKCDAWAQAQIANKRSSNNIHLMYYDEYLKTVK